MLVVFLGQVSNLIYQEVKELVDRFLSDLKQTDVGLSDCTHTLYFKIQPEIERYLALRSLAWWALWMEGRGQITNLSNDLTSSAM